THQAFKAESEALLGYIWDKTFETVDAEQVYEVLKARHFVILQGPPGTGKTRLAESIRRDFFQGRGIPAQFHPAVTYEDFVVGLSPDVQAAGLRFRVRPYFSSSLMKLEVSTHARSTSHIQSMSLTTFAYQGG